METAGLGVILDSSVAIEADREQLNAADFLRRIANAIGDPGGIPQCGDRRGTGPIGARAIAIVGVRPLMSPFYETVLREVEALSESEQLRLVAQLSARLHGPAPSQPATSILDLQGLGRDLWRAQDAQDYVNHERSSWNG